MLIGHAQPSHTQCKKQGVRNTAVKIQRAHLTQERGEEHVQIRHRPERSADPQGLFAHSWILHGSKHIRA